jgi:tripartite-type tricarboxylate transporter receptor subunit TctC
VRQRLETMGTVPVGSTPEAFAAFIDSETAKWGRVIREAKVTPD